MILFREECAVACRERRQVVICHTRCASDYIKQSFLFLNHASQYYYQMSAKEVLVACLSENIRNRSVCVCVFSLSSFIFSTSLSVRVLRNN